MKFEKIITIGVIALILIMAVGLSLSLARIQQLEAITRKTAVKFALSHEDEATQFAEAFQKMEEKTQNAAKQVMGEWLQGTKVSN